MSTLFRPGETLIVQPKDNDDPDANHRQGQECVFVRYYSHAHCTVKFADQVKPRVFRAQDLRRRDA